MEEPKDDIFKLIQLLEEALDYIERQKDIIKKDTEIIKQLRERSDKLFEIELAKINTRIDACNKYKWWKFWVKLDKI